MIVGIPKEIMESEKRVAATPLTARGYIKKGWLVYVEVGAGAQSYFSDRDYEDAGAKIINNPEELYNEVDFVLKVQHPVFNQAVKKHEVDMMKEEGAFVSFFQVSREEELVKKIMAKKILGFSMHKIPRITLAQKMDALSSQSSIAGYKAVLVGASRIGKYMPLLMTAAGTIPPAKVLILGAGVAGLQAIATAKRLGAHVEAFDVRPEVGEQVKSLGANFVNVSTDQDEGVGEGGYAKETSEEYKERQMLLIQEHLLKSDLVISTALIPDKPAPILITEEMVSRMQPGSVIMDIASENGGNCALTEPGKVIVKNQVQIDGTLNWPSTVSIHASQLYAKNVSAFVHYLCDEGEIKINREDEIISSALFTEYSA